jgi:hypothetical protein
MNSQRNPNVSFWVGSSWASPADRTPTGFPYGCARKWDFHPPGRNDCGPGGRRGTIPYHTIPYHLIHRSQSAKEDISHPYPAITRREPSPSRPGPRRGARKPSHRHRHRSQRGTRPSQRRPARRAPRGRQRAGLGCVAQHAAQQLAPQTRAGRGIATLFIDINTCIVIE